MKGYGQINKLVSKIYCSKMEEVFCSIPYTAVFIKEPQQSKTNNVLILTTDWLCTNPFLESLVEQQNVPC